jgi:hypothetical protein
VVATDAERRLGCPIELPPGWDAWYDAEAGHLGACAPAAGEHVLAHAHLPGPFAVVLERWFVLDGRDAWTVAGMTPALVLVARRPGRRRRPGHAPSLRGDDDRARAGGAPRHRRPGAVAGRAAG